MLIRNTAANFLAQLCLPVVSFLLTPFFINHLGLEGYGLIGFFGVVSILLTTVSTGLCSVFQRETALLAADPTKRLRLPSLVRAMEGGFFAAALLVAAGIALASGLISSRWLHLETIPPSTARTCVLAIGVSIAASVMITLYSALLSGLEHFIALSRVNVTFILGGAVLAAIVVGVTQSLVAYYLVTGAVAVLQAGWLRRVLHRHLPASQGVDGTGSRNEVLRLCWEARALVWTHAAGNVISLADRLVVSRLMPVSSLAVLNVGTTCGRILSLGCGPIGNTAFPRFCTLAGNGEQEALTRFLLRVSGATLLVSLSLGLPVALFSHDVLTVWTRHADLAHQGAFIMLIYMAAAIFLANGAVLYQVLIAAGRARWPAAFNSVAVAVYPLVMVGAVIHAGLHGAAWTWLGYCASNYLFLAAGTFSFVAESGRLPRYAWMTASSVCVVTALTLAARAGADAWCPSAPLLRLGWAGAAGIAGAAAAYLCVFGTHVPAEIRMLVGRLGQEPPDSSSVPPNLP